MRLNCILRSRHNKRQEGIACFFSLNTFVRTVAVILSLYFARILFITGITFSFPGKARPPPGRKHFWTSMISNAVLGDALVIAIQQRIVTMRLK